MADKLTPMISELEPLLRMLGSGSDGEVVNVIRIVRKKLKAGGADVHALVDRIVKPLASSTADQAEIMRAYERGRLQGIYEAKREANGIDGFENHSWKDIAAFCNSNADRLGNQFEKDFCASLAKWARHSALSAKQKDVLRRIFVNRFDGEF